jgi:hypothetical protein
MYGRRWHGVCAVDGMLNICGLDAASGELDRSDSKKVPVFHTGPQLSTGSGGLSTGRAVVLRSWAAAAGRYFEARASRILIRSRRR